MSHSGAFALEAATTFILLPSENLGSVVLTNGEPDGLPGGAFHILDLVESGEPQLDWLELFGTSFAAAATNRSVLVDPQVQQERIDHPVSGKRISAYAGTYRNRYYGIARSEGRGSGLVMRLGPRRIEFPLTHWNGDRFSYLPTGENALGIAAVDFSMRREGKASKLTVENLNANRLGAFIRGIE